MTQLETPRLLLRPLSDGDEALYCRLYSDPVVMAHVAAPQAVDAARRGFATALRLNAATPALRRFWVLQDRASGEDHGMIGLSLDEPGGGEVGVLLGAESQGRGLATQAIASLATHAFDTLALQRLHTRHDAGHGQAAGLMRRLGFESTACAQGELGWRWQLTARAWTRGPGDKNGPTR